MVLIFTDTLFYSLLMPALFLSHPLVMSLDHNDNVSRMTILIRLVVPKQCDNHKSDL